MHEFSVVQSLHFFTKHYSLFNVNWSFLTIFYQSSPSCSLEIELRQRSYWLELKFYKNCELNPRTTYSAKMEIVRSFDIKSNSSIFRKTFRILWGAPRFSLDLFELEKRNRFELFQSIFEHLFWVQRIPKNPFTRHSIYEPEALLKILLRILQTIKQTN